MSEYMNLSIITSDKTLFSGEVKKLITEDLNGDIEILPKHISMITILNPSITKFEDKQHKEFEIFTSNGVLTVKNNNITMTCEAAEWKENIDFERAKSAKERAEGRLKNHEKGTDIKRAEAALLRAITRLKLKDI